MARSPHPLIVGLLSTAVVVTLALGWSGWRLIAQQRDLDRLLLSEQAGAGPQPIDGTSFV